MIAASDRANTATCTRPLPHTRCKLAEKWPEAPATSSRKSNWFKGDDTMGDAQEDIHKHMDVRATIAQLRGGDGDDGDVGRGWGGG
jgi:hypothetical protein